VNSTEIALESQLKLVAKLINDRLSGQSLLLKWDQILHWMNSSQGRCAADPTEGGFNQGNQVESSISLSLTRWKYASVE
jgi:hypothetical protein